MQQDYEVPSTMPARNEINPSTVTQGIGGAGGTTDNEARKTDHEIDGSQMTNTNTAAKNVTVTDNDIEIRSQLKEGASV